MPSSKSHIISALRKDILLMQGFKPALHASDVLPDLGPIQFSFPNATFPVGSVHEFICDGIANTAATCGFTSGILSSLMRKGAVCVWIASSPTIYPPALASFGIAPEKVIFIDLQKERDKLWTIEEALKCEGLAAVVGEIQELSFTASRRLQLAVEQSRVTGFIMRSQPKKLHTTASVCRWKISSLPGDPVDDLPGIGFPKWNVELLKVRNGKPGSWQVKWMKGKFWYTYEPGSFSQSVQRKTG